MSRTSSSRRSELATGTQSRRPAGPAAGTVTRLATFVLLLVGALVALLIAMRLVAAAAGWSFSPFGYVTPPGGHSLRAWVLLAIVVVLAALLYLVLRGTGDALWLPSTAAPGGVLVPAADLEQPVAAAAARTHPDILRADAELFTRGGELCGRMTVYARPLAARDGVREAAEAAVRRQVTRITGRELARFNVRVKVLRVGQLARYLP